MPARRYTIVIADRSNGLVRRLTISLRVIAIVGFTAIGLPILVGLGPKGDTYPERAPEVRRAELRRLDLTDVRVERIGVSS